MVYDLRTKGHEACFIDVQGKQLHRCRVAFQSRAKSEAENGSARGSRKPPDRGPTGAACAEIMASFLLVHLRSECVESQVQPQQVHPGITTNDS
jgi:hypothetical protein